MAIYVAVVVPEIAPVIHEGAIDDRLVELRLENAVQRTQLNLAAKWALVLGALKPAVNARRAESVLTILALDRVEEQLHANRADKIPLLLTVNDCARAYF